MVQADMRNDGWFYRLTEDIEIDTGFNHDAQRRHVMALQGLGLLDVDRRGIPPRRWFKINIVRLHELVSAKEAEIETAKRELHQRRQKAAYDAVMEQATQQLLNRVAP